MRAIYLIGMPGSGKSTIGKELAKRLGLDFLDTDEVILKETGRTPEQIIEEDGEKMLRVYEANLLDQILQKTDIVVSTGGGLPIYGDNMAKLLHNTHTVYFKCSTEMIWERLRNDRIRPLSKTKHEVEQMLENREAIYSKASVIIEIEDDPTIENVILRLMEIFRRDGIMKLSY